MAENTKGQNPNTDRNREDSSSEELRGNIGRHRTASDHTDERSSDSGLDEKSSGMGRRDKGTGLSSKDGVTGSDLDGQVTQ